MPYAENDGLSLYSFWEAFFQKELCREATPAGDFKHPRPGVFHFFWRASTYVFRLPFLNVLMLKNDIYGGEIKSLRTR